MRKARQAMSWRVSFQNILTNTAVFLRIVKEVLFMTVEQKAQIKSLRYQGVGYGTISKMLGISSNTVSSFCRRNKLGSTKNESICKQCGKPLEIKPKRKPRKFCSDACRLTWWNNHLEYVDRKAMYSFVCAECGKPFTAYGNVHRKYCSRECYIKGRYRKGKLR